jgi:hypothetical protein
VGQAKNEATRQSARQALPGFSRGSTESRRRKPCSFIRSSKRRAQTNSAARTPRASMMVSQPGPGVIIIRMPATSNVNPNRIFRNRFVCCKDFISTFLSRFDRKMAAAYARVLLDAAQLTKNRHAREFPSRQVFQRSKFRERRPCRNAPRDRGGTGAAG